ncbi:spore germination lipoprotein GerD [Paenibacillus pini]|uniref:Spore germination protein GerD n=1 Tax=Paenibacillus pini JCM 16418 TaxID=1236976 RepID=W7YSV9_9BACL|nr:spore germination lipoprotein GerD [Paenibacillus pini]GAF10283.1 spore germination protein GerD [Paenibacillus pini JCM 16418]
MKWPAIGMWGLILGLSAALTGCGSEQNYSQQPQGDYKEMKTMVVDILKSDEGKKAVEESLKGGSQGGGSGGMKMMSLQASDDIRTAVKDTLTAPEYKKELEKIMTDPSFAGDFAKAINSQNKEIHKQLIKDPTYQKAVADIMKSPEIMKMFLDLTKTPDFRKQSMTVMQEAMQSPLFRMEVMNLLKTVVTQELQPKVEKGKDEGDKSKEGGDQGGGSDKEGGGSQEGEGGGDSGT